jgi:hypothetical protein
LLLHSVDGHHEVLIRFRCIHDYDPTSRQTGMIVQSHAFGFKCSAEAAQKCCRNRSHCLLLNLRSAVIAFEMSLTSQRIRPQPFIAESV